MFDALAETFPAEMKLGIRAGALKLDNDRHFYAGPQVNRSAELFPQIALLCRAAIEHKLIANLDGRAAHSVHGERVRLAVARLDQA